MVTLKEKVQNEKKKSKCRSSGQFSNLLKWPDFIGFMILSNQTGIGK
jgi:hypothetical protein